MVGKSIVFNIPSFRGHHGCFHDHGSGHYLIVIGGHHLEIRIVITNDALETRTAFALASQRSAGLHGNNLDEVGGFVVLQHKIVLLFVSAFSLDDSIVEVDATAGVSSDFLLEKGSFVDE